MLRALLFIAVAAVVIYGLVWVVQTLRARREGAARARQTVAPDDDPVFLAQLDRQLAEQRRQAERARRAAEKAAAAANEEPGDTVEPEGDTPDGSEEGEQSPEKRADGA